MAERTIRRLDRQQGGLEICQICMLISSYIARTEKGGRIEPYTAYKIESAETGGKAFDNSPRAV